MDGLLNGVCLLVYLGLNLDTGELIAVKLVELVGDINLHRAEVLIQNKIHTRNKT